MKKNILLLGGNGFIGKNLIKEFLSTNNYNIIVFDKNNKFPEDKLNNFIKYYNGDFSCLETLERIFKDNKIDIVFHLISTIIPSSSNENIIHDIDKNIKPTIKLLNLMKKYKVKKIVFFSSGGTVYRTPPSLPYKKFNEESVTNPICLYGIIKLTIEKYLYFYKHFYNIDYLILRVANLYGENHFSNKQGFINIALKKIINKEPLLIFGDGSNIRDYIYIKDFTRIIKLLIERNIFNEVINIGSGEGHSINEIIEIIKRIENNFIIKKMPTRKFDITNIVLDTSKLKKIINFTPTDIELGIKETYKWTKSIKRNI
jgi:UDP-glucose 4-epimerase